MAITASAITPDKSLEEFRVEFNKLIQDFDGVASGNSFVQSIVFEGATADAFETALLVVDPTADRSITLPDATGTVVTTGNASDPATSSSSGDADFVLVSDGGVLKKITPANLGIGGSAGSVAADDVAAGDDAVNITTTVGNITIDAAANDTDIIFKGTDNTADITMLTLDGSDAGKAIFNGAISATTITLSADAGLLLPNDGNIGSAGSTAAMQISSGGIVTFVDDILIKDGGTIGNASVADVLTLAATGIVTFKDDIVLKDAATIGVASSTSAISIASTGIVSFIDDIAIKDGGTIGSASAPTAMTISAAGIVTFLDDILVKNDGTIGSAGTAAAMTISSGGIVTFADDILIKNDGTIGSAGDADAIAIASNGVVTFTQIPVMPANSIDSDEYIDGSIDKEHLSAGAKTEVIAIACGDESTAHATGTAVVTFHMPYAFTLTGVKAGLTVAPVGSVFTVDINEAGTTILSTKITIDASEKTSGTAATAAVISDTALAADALMTIDIDGVGSSTAGAGLKVYLIGHVT